MSYDHLKSRHQLAVESFMREDAKDPRSNNQVADTPIIPSAKIRRLRAALILEEAIETVNALGFGVWVEHDLGVSGMLVSLPDAYHPNLTKIIDGCCDLRVVATGTLSACGIPDEPFLQEIEANNMKKLTTSPGRDENGKLLKATDHQPPDIEGLLEKLERGEL